MVGTVLAGKALTWSTGLLSTAVLLSIVSIALYSAGMVFNDLFDRKVDAFERPERPIPAGRVTPGQASFLGNGLVTIALIIAFSLSLATGIAALILTLFIFAYNLTSKRLIRLSIIPMGLCRGANFMLGASLYPDVMPEVWLPVLALIIFVCGITLASKGEVFGGSKLGLAAAFGAYMTALCLLLLLADNHSVSVWSALPFFLFWLLFSATTLFMAYQTQAAIDIRRAVKAGILSIIPLNAAVVGGFCGFYPALLLFMLFPVSYRASNIFSVT